MPTLFPVVCQECGKTFMVRPYRVGVAKFCSLSCGGKWALSHRKMVNPNLKGNQFRKGKRPANAFTSEQVRGANNTKWIEPIRRTCKQCGKSFEKKPWQMGKQRRTADFCSNECSALYKHLNLRGANSPHWVGGIKTYRGRNWLNVRQIIVAAQDGNCADCGRHLGKSLPIHHIKPFREFQSAAEANVVENLVGLCQSCHMHREHPKTSAS